MTDETPAKREQQEIEEAIGVLQGIAFERGVENGWLYEVMPNIPWPEDPRAGLVKGGPDVVLMLLVAPVLDILRSGLRMKAGPRRDEMLALTRAVNEGAAMPTHAQEEAGV